MASKSAALVLLIGVGICLLLLWQAEPPAEMVLSQSEGRAVAASKNLDQSHPNESAPAASESQQARIEEDVRGKGISVGPNLDVQNDRAPSKELPGRGLLGFDWNEYRGRLAARVLYAIEEKDGDVAFKLARVIHECLMVSLMRSDGTSVQLTSADYQGEASFARSINDIQRNFAECQSVPGNLEEVHRRLLDIATRVGVVGAASEVFIRSQNPERHVLRQVVIDARSGHRTSLMLVASNKASVFGVSPGERQIMQYALKIAADEPSLGWHFQPYKSRAEKAASILSGEPVPQFDLLMLDGESLESARILASRALDRVRAGN